MMLMVVNTEDSDHALGGIGLEGVGVEEDSSDGDVLGRLNELVRRRAQEQKDAQLNIPAETEPEMWNCSLCDTDMAPAMRQAHELHPFHVRRLEMKKREAGGPMVRGFKLARYRVSLIDHRNRKLEGLQITERPYSDALYA